VGSESANLNGSWCFLLVHTYRFVSEEEQKQKLVKENGRLQQQVKEQQGAMQELGTELQTLQLIHSRATERKWDKDREIIACTGCRRNFTVSTRKVSLVRDQERVKLHNVMYVYVHVG
jgi:hypothetical protein